MSSNVVSLRAGLPDPLAELRAERAKLDAEFQRLAVVDERRAAAEAKIAEVDGALAQLDAADRQAIEAWAETAAGEPPAPRLDERKGLMARRLDAEAERQAAEIAVAAVEQRRVGLIHAMNAVSARIRERQIAAALEQARGLHAEALKIADELAGRLQRVMGLRSAIIIMTTEAARRNDAHHGRALNIALAEVDALPRPEILADPATVDAHAAKWMEGLR